MRLSKEIFGIERKRPYTLAISGPGIDNTQFNNCLDLIDQYELSEEELGKIIFNNIYGGVIEISHPHYKWYLDYCNLIGKSIKQNQSKIFVRKSK